MLKPICQLHMVCNRNPHTHHYPDHTYPEKCPPFSRHLRTVTQNNQTIRTPPPLLRPPAPPPQPPSTHTHTYTFNQKINCQVHTQTYHTKTQAYSNEFDQTFVWLTFFILTEKKTLFLIAISNPGHPTMPSKCPRKKTDTEGFLFSIEILNIPLDVWATNPCQDIGLF